ncbi:MAG: chromosome condensation regulator RCC1 [Rhodobacter sp.]|nr:hypothetical protein [Paracoccaceae bacterium]MCC0076284.1 chromosome condensation regulator RCC1 [Rhodobacter sp.]
MNAGLLLRSLLVIATLMGGPGLAQVQDPVAESQQALLAPVTADGGVRSVAGGYGHSCAVSGRGNVWCWGYNQFGQLGIGTTESHQTPQRVVINGEVVSVGLGSVFTCALTTEGEVYCWGYNNHGELGDSTYTGRLSPTRVAFPRSNIRSLAVGTSHACAIDSRGRLWCWGNNVQAQLGDGTVLDRTTPARVSGIPGPITAVSAGYWHTCALARQGRAWCWGSNFRGQLGIDSMVSQRRPVRVVGLGRDNLAIDVGGHTSCAIDRRNFLLCWGANDTGQLGVGTTELSLVPQRVSGTRFRSVSVGNSSLTGAWATTCAVTRRGSGYCWGLNDHGQLGIGTTDNASLPQRISGLGSDIRSFAVANNGVHTCGINGSGVAFCWGSNAFGQLGDGTTTDQPTPNRVQGRLHTR